MLVDQELRGVSQALDRFEHRVRSHRKDLKKYVVYGTSTPNLEESQITEGEVETIEAIVRGLACRVTGQEPLAEAWEPLHPYCSRNVEKTGSGHFAQNYEFFRWALLWIKKTRMYLEFLEGCQSATVERLPPQETDYETHYDVALSFAGEDREHAHKIAGLLGDSGYTVFYDKYEQASLWGRNLYDQLWEVYNNRARYCLMFISANYGRERWTEHERRAAEARASRESREYILRLLLDDTELPGIEAAAGYIDLRTTTSERAVRLICEKLESISKGTDA